MTRSIRQSAASRRWLAIIAACAIALRILIPVGFMPAISADRIVVELCEGEGGGHAVVDLGRKGMKPDRAAGDHCAFAGISGGLVPPAQIAAMPFVPVLAALPLGRAIADLTVSRLAAPPPPAQGPPAAL